MNIKKTTLLICLASILSLTACGIKPGSVSAPASVEHDTFPQNYPNPETKPTP